jgi:hypothetical protein
LLSPLELQNNPLAKKLFKFTAVSDDENWDVLTEPTHKPGGQQPGQTIQHLRRTSSGAAGKRPGHHDQVPATRDEAAADTQEFKKKSLYTKRHSAQPGMFWRTHHTKPDPKIDVGDASFLMRCKK